jgi:hypothetical protein
MLNLDDNNDIELIESNDTLNYWQKECLLEDYVEPTFHNLSIISKELSQVNCCLYVKYDNEVGSYETIIMFGQDYLFNQQQLISLSSATSPSTLTIQLFEIFKNLTIIQNQQPLTYRALLGFNYDTKRSYICGKVIVNYFTKETYHSTQEQFQVFNNFILPILQQQLIQNNVAIRCNHRLQDNRQCARMTKGKLSCFQHIK